MKWRMLKSVVLAIQKKPRLLCTRVINANSLDIHLYRAESQQQEPLHSTNQIAKLGT